ncbi:MAG: 6-bladed beta-propeller [Tannerella sp.]|nr:6-bladed beta-propeller [Tannerella sp.]
MKQITLFSILSILMMQSCVNQEASNDVFKDVPIVINIDTVKSNPLNSLKFSHIRYIPLETDEECLIGFANKILIRDSRIYVADFHKAMALFVFDMNGKFLFKIARRGQGVGEYVSFRDFDIQTNGDLYMFDQHRKKILIYNSAGEYLREIYSDFYFSKFCLVNNRMYWSELIERGNTFANLVAYDMTDKRTEFILKDEKFLHNEGIINFSDYNFYYSPDNTVYYSPKFSEIIYSIGENGVYPAIGVKNLKIPPKHIIDGWLQENDIFKRSGLIKNSKYFIENAYIYETDKYITFACVKDVLPDVLLYNKCSKSVRSSWISDYFYGVGIDRIKGSTGKEFFGVIAFNPDNESHRKILASREELKNWNEEDNPVIVFFNPDM